jgi:hypothetical protein
MAKSKKTIESKETLVDFIKSELYYTNEQLQDWAAPALERIAAQVEEIGGVSNYELALACKHYLSFNLNIHPLIGAVMARFIEQAPKSSPKKFSQRDVAMLLHGAIKRGMPRTEAFDKTLTYLNERGGNKTMTALEICYRREMKKRADQK